MRQEYKSTSKKRILLLSAMGVVPFYFEFFLYLIYPELYYNNELMIKGSSGFYGSLIISFLSGMHFERLISKKSTQYYVIPMFPVIFLWISFIFYSNFIFYSLVIIGLLWCLFMEIFFIKTIDYWYFKMRFFVTILAIIPLFSIIIIKQNQ